MAHSNSTYSLTTTDYIYSGELCGSGTTSGALLTAGSLDSTLVSNWTPAAWSFDDNFIKSLADALEKNKEENPEKVETRWDINSKRKERISRVSIYAASREFEINLSAKRRRRVQVRI